MDGCVAWWLLKLAREKNPKCESVNRYDGRSRYYVKQNDQKKRHLQALFFKCGKMPHALTMRQAGIMHLTVLVLCERSCLVSFRCC